MLANSIQLFDCEIEITDNHIVAPAVLNPTFSPMFPKADPDLLRVSLLHCSGFLEPGLTILLYALWGD